MPLLLAVLAERLAERREPSANHKPLDRTESWAADLKLSGPDMDLKSLPLRTRKGYCLIILKKKPVVDRARLFIHRVIMSRMIGRTIEPREHVDHLNGDKLDNRRENLRLTDNSGNQQNKHKVVSKTGYIGVDKKGRRFRVRLRKRIDGKRVVLHVSFHSTPEQAALAYNSAAEQHGFLTRNIIRESAV